MIGRLSHPFLADSLVGFLGKRAALKAMIQPLLQTTVPLRGILTATLTAMTKKMRRWLRMDYHQKRECRTHTQLLVGTMSRGKEANAMRSSRWVLFCGSELTLPSGLDGLGIET